MLTVWKVARVEGKVVFSGIVTASEFPGFDRQSARRRSFDALVEPRALCRQID